MKKVIITSVLSMALAATSFAQTSLNSSSKQISPDLSQLNSKPMINGQSTSYDLFLSIMKQKLSNLSPFSPTIDPSDNPAGYTIIGIPEGRTKAGTMK